MHTPEFRIQFVDSVHVQTLMVLRVAMKGWSAAADVLIDEEVRSGELIVHGGKDVNYQDTRARRERRKLATRVIFLLNITKVGEYAGMFAANLVVVDIPEGVESICQYAFDNCTSLTTVSFHTTLKLLVRQSFECCSSLENVDLLHTTFKN
ncbi:hypothetical protein TrLO_g4409 [Triparma laevis f. longispina]|uniref:Uncharacterized protein n=1 Tax=Triparma laevis f. longispina TaxID=1714387 RepID=A0A9W7DQG2_9STRA|nr:hypothetical protein TrLO_g4409 [Triparma laevis f. longispina]